MHEAGLILTLAGGLAAALVCGYATHRIGLSPIVGYLAAGLLVGPYTPGFVADTALATQLAEVGVILLMFGVGLQFHIEELLAVRRIAIPGAIVQSAVATALGAAVVHALGWSWAGAIVFGLCLSVASTVVLVRVLSDARALHTQAGHIAVGWLVVEDLFTVVVLVLMPVVVGSAEPARIALDLGLTLLKVAGLVAFAAIVGRRLIPVVLDRVAATGSRELFTLTVLVVALGIAVGSAVVFGVSMALGAFLAGMVVGRSDYSLRAATEALPMRDAFAVLFFVSVGMLLDPGALLRSPGATAAALAVVVLAKPLVAVVMLALSPLSDTHGADRRAGARPDRRVLVHPDHAGARSESGAGRSARHRGGGGHRLDHDQPAHVQGRSIRSTAGSPGAGPGAPASRSTATCARRRRSPRKGARSSSATAPPAAWCRGCCARTPSCRRWWI